MRIGVGTGAALGATIAVGLGVLWGADADPTKYPEQSAEAAWAIVQNATDPDMLIDFLQTYPDSDHVTQAYARLEALVSDTQVTRGATSPSGWGGPAQLD